MRIRPSYVLTEIAAVALATGCSGRYKDTSPIPIGVVTIAPSSSPTIAPSSSPTSISTTAPITIPTTGPSANPTNTPTTVPTTKPTTKPTTAPTASPTATAVAPSNATAVYADPGEACTGGGLDYNGGPSFPSTFNCANGFNSSTSTMPPPDANGRIDLIQSEFNSYESTNATGMSATSSGTYYIGNSNPAAFVVPGTVFAEAQVSLSDTPSVLDFGGNSFFELDIGFTIQNSPSTISTNGETYTCTVFDNGTKIGSGTSTSVVGTGVMNGTMQEVDGCNATSNTTNTGSDYNDPNAQAGHTFVNLPNTTTYNINDTYTLILSH